MLKLKFPTIINFLFFKFKCAEQNKGAILPWYSPHPAQDIIHSDNTEGRTKWTEKIYGKKKTETI